MNFEYGFIGHCFDATENHDKIWGYFFRSSGTNNWSWKGGTNWANEGRNIVIFWGRRGKAMQFKPDVYSVYDTEKLKNSKMDKKGYIEITEQRLMEIWPSFKDEAEMKLSLEVLSGRVK
jgi:hypothetical protein